MRTAFAVVIAAVAVLGTGGAGAAAPASFQLVFDGKHTASLLHEGTFTTSSSSCRSGTAADVAIDEATLTATRQFTCAEGGGFTAKVGPLPAEHGGGGSWQIVAGSGPLADLRGMGTFTSVRLSGDLTDPAAITFRSTWTGVTDLDAVPPTVRVTHWHAKKLARPGAYKVRFALSPTDNGGGLVSFVLQLVDPRKPASPLVYKLGKSASGASVTRSFRIKVSKRTRLVRLKVDASDPVGNKSAFAKRLRLR